MTNSIRDIAENSKLIFIIGSNTAEQHPVIGIKIRRAVPRRGAKLIVADPRRVDLATYADLYLRHQPGTDIALMNGLMHIILREGGQDEAFIAERTEGIEELRAVVAKYTPALTSEIEEKLQALLDAMPPGRNLNDQENTQSSREISPSSESPDVLASRPG